MESPCAESAAEEVRDLEAKTEELKSTNEARAADRDNE